MALDRQKILGELGSVMKQLQNADCGCLGKLFGNPQQTGPPVMGTPLPTCGGCRRACCHGHGYGQYNSPTPMNHFTPNMECMPMKGSNPTQQPISGNMYGFGPQIVNMMTSEQNKQNITGQPQGQLYGQTPALPDPMVTETPKVPYEKVALTPFVSTPTTQQGQFNSATGNQVDVARQMQLQSIPQLSNNIGGIANMNPIPQQHITSNPASSQMHTPQMNSWPQQNMASNPVTYQTPHSNYNRHGQHSEGIAKFNKMFPGVKQGMEGDLGFDPMAIAIQMNPDNRLQTAMNTMNKIMYDNKEMVQKSNKPPESQPRVADNILNESPPLTNGTLQHNTAPDLVVQDNVNHFINEQRSINRQYASASEQPLPQQNQQIYAAAVDPNTLNRQMRHEELKILTDQQQNRQQQIMELNPNLSLIQPETTENIKFDAPSLESTGYPNQTPKQNMIKEPIFPVDNTKNINYVSKDQTKNNSYGYNTLGQPVEMLPAKMYHHIEPSLPQTLSPQPNLVKPRNNPMQVANVKETVSRTPLMDNKQAGKTPSRSHLQHIYNQYKGSQSFTQQNVRGPSEGTYSVGRLNVPQGTKAEPVPVEGVGGDTAVNNPLSNQDHIHKVEQVVGQIGDVPPPKPTSDSLPKEETSVPVRKCRNGLQDMVFSSYPTSAAWTFHGHGRKDYSLTPRYRHRH